MAITKEALLQYLESELRLRIDRIDLDTSLFASGLIDSISMMELVVFIEHNAQIKIGAADLTLENVDSIARILAFVQRRKPA